MRTSPRSPTPCSRCRRSIRRSSRSCPSCPSSSSRTTSPAAAAATSTTPATSRSPSRWSDAQPLRYHRPLAFSQQFAVNQILRTLSDTCGVFAVNGPPGTGKTTMLHDVIAAIVVNRAIELACLASPGETFTTAREQWQPVRYSHTITTPNPKLTSFEIVVTSSNNGAVDNVSTEIPGPKGIGGQWRDAAATVDYFSQTAGHDAWAMIAARLGNRANRATFVQDFWWNRDSGMQNMLGQTAALRPDWQGAVTSFRRALSRVRDLSAERSVVSHSITRLPIASRDHALADDTDAVLGNRHRSYGKFVVI